jgi:hypothetical protein
MGRILTETDALLARIEGRTTLPRDVDIVMGRLATVWKNDSGEVEKVVGKNYTQLLKPVLVESIKMP